MVSQTMSDNAETETEEKSEEQAIETGLEAHDAESIEERLPADVRERLTKAAFSPGAIKALLRDTYYMGPIATGTGGWRGMFGGQPGTGLRRPNGAFYNQPRSWRYAAMERALETGLVTRTGAGWVATERGAAVLAEIDRCHECGRQREPMVSSSYYQGNPNTEGHIESHRLVTACPEHRSTGYGNPGDSVQTSYSPYERDEDRVESVAEILAEYPEARSYGLDREIRDVDAAEGNGLTDEEQEEILTEHIEEHVAGTPREIFGAVTEDLYGNPTVAVPGDGQHYKWYGTEDAMVVSRTDEAAEVHFDVDDADEGTLIVRMSRETALDDNAKEAVKSGRSARWDNARTAWTLDAKDLPHVLSTLTGGEFVPRHESEGLRLTATVTSEAVDLVPVPVPGVDEDGNLVTADTSEDEDEESEDDEDASEDEEDLVTDGGEDDLTKWEEAAVAALSCQHNPLRRTLTWEDAEVEVHEDALFLTMECPDCGVTFERTFEEKALHPASPEVADEVETLREADKDAMEVDA